MPREKDGYRDNIELLNERFPDKQMLTYAECAEFMGCSLRTAQRKIRINPAIGRITKADFARQVTV